MAGITSGTGPVLIAGGGIGGLAAALALAATGRASHVLEQSTRFGEIGAGIQLGPNVFKMFERMGLTEAVEAVAFFPENLIMRDSTTGDLVTCIPVGSTELARDSSIPMPSSTEPTCTRCCSKLASGRH
jgi:3-hydroxybenzoate 6-monooxygenase